MSLHKSRKIISIILTVLIACGSILFFGTLITKVTVMSESYTSYVFDKVGVTKNSKEAFANQIKVLEAQSGIPARVFNSVYNFNDATSKTAVERLFSSSNTTLNTNSQTDKFEKLCKEYLEGNNMQYDEALIHNTALKATEAYSNCFGMKNTEQISSFIKNVNAHYQSYLSVGALLFIVPLVLLIILFRRSLDVAFNIFSALTLLGFIFCCLRRCKSYCETWFARHNAGDISTSFLQLRKRCMLYKHYFRCCTHHNFCYSEHQNNKSA